MKNIFIKSVLAVLLLTSCSKYNSGKIQYIPPSSPPDSITPPPELSPEEKLTLLDKINGVKNLQEIELFNFPDYELSNISWDEPYELSDGYYRAHVVTKNEKGDLEYIKKEHIIKHRNQIGIKKDIIIDELEVFVFLERDNEILYKGTSVAKIREQLEINPFTNLGADNFWDNPRHIFGEGLLNYNGQGKDRLASNAGRSRMSFNDDETILWIVDGDRNRVMIYANIDALRCRENYSQDPDVLKLCLSSAKFSPLLPYGVLGREDFFTQQNCNQYEKCLNRPVDVLYKEGKLYISDSYNNRVVIMDNPSVYGCFNIDSFLGKQTPRSCEFDRLVGKAQIDSNTYQPNPIASLYQPRGLDIYKGNLYIADSRNDRIVVAEGIDDPQKWNCTPKTYGNEGCRFSYIIGQRDFDSYDEQYNYFGDTLYTDWENKKIVDQLGVMKRLFYQPDSIKITENGDLIVGVADYYWDGKDGTNDGLGDETYAELNHRILIFKDLPKTEQGHPYCDSQSFDIGLCDANLALGQNNMNEVFLTEFYDDWQTEILDFDTSLTSIFALTSFHVKGNTIISTDQRNSSIKIWYDYTTLTADDVTPDFTTSQLANDFELPNVSHTLISNERESLLIVAGNRLVEIPFRPEANNEPR